MILFDIAFNFGDNYFEDNSSLLKIVVPIFLSSLLSFLIAIMMFNKQKRNDKDKDNERLKNVEEYYNTLIESLQKPIVNQISNFAIFARLLNKNREVEYNLGITASFRTERILEVDGKDLFAIFITNKDGDLKNKIEYFQKLQRQIDYISEISINFKDAYKNLIRRKELHYTQWNTNISLFAKSFDNIINHSLTMNLDLTKDDLIHSISLVKQAMIDKLRPEGNEDYKDYHITYIELIKPARRICLNHQADPRSNLLLDHIMSCTTAYENLIYIANYYKKYFIQTAKELKKAQKEMNESSNYFKQIGNKFSKN